MAFYQPPNKKMVEAINNIGKVCPMGLEFKPALCKTKHFIAKAKRKKGKLIDFNFCEKCELVMNMIAEEKKNKQITDTVPEKLVSEATETVKPQPEIKSVDEKCPTCNISFSLKRKIKGLCVNCYERQRRKNTIQAKTAKCKDNSFLADGHSILLEINKKSDEIHKKIKEHVKGKLKLDIQISKLDRVKFSLL